MEHKICFIFLYNFCSKHFLPQIVISSCAEGGYKNTLIFIYIYIYLLTAIGLTPSGSNTVHIYTQTIHRTTQLTTLVERLSGIQTQADHVEFLSLLCVFNQN